MQDGFRKRLKAMIKFHETYISHYTSLLKHEPDRIEEIRKEIDRHLEELAPLYETLKHYE